MAVPLNRNHVLRRPDRRIHRAAIWRPIRFLAAAARRASGRMDRGNEHLHHFMIPGKMSDLPYKGEDADYRGLKYRVYGSDKLNLVVWQDTPEMVSVLAGHRSAPELAEMARTGDPE